MEERKNVFSYLGKGLMDYTESRYKLTILSGVKRLPRQLHSC
jgi:hypothetical protein